MMNKIRKTLLGCTVALATAFGATTAQAADPPAPMYVTTWSGFYLGGHLGWGWDKSDMDITTANFWATDPVYGTTLNGHSPFGVPSASRLGHHEEVAAQFGRVGIIVRLASWTELSKLTVSGRFSASA